jgi:hypothetical protein
MVEGGLKSILNLAELGHKIISREARRHSELERIIVEYIMHYEI